jgi:hypothetical protein
VSLASGEGKCLTNFSILEQIRTTAAIVVGAGDAGAVTSAAPLSGTMPNVAEGPTKVEPGAAVLSSSTFMVAAWTRNPAERCLSLAHLLLRQAASCATGVAAHRDGAVAMGADSGVVGSNPCIAAVLWTEDAILPQADQCISTVSDSCGGIESAQSSWKQEGGEEARVRRLLNDWRTHIMKQLQERQDESWAWMAASGDAAPLPNGWPVKKRVGNRGKESCGGIGEVLSSWPSYGSWEQSEENCDASCPRFLMCLISPVVDVRPIACRFGTYVGTATSCVVLGDRLDLISQ